MGITVENEAPGDEPHDVSLTFDNRYGVCRDKAALLVALLRLAGFDAYPVLIYVGPKKDPEVPQPWFNHAITAVRNEDGSWQLMDATNENTRDLLPGYLSHRSYLVATPQGETLQTSPVVPPEENLLAIEVDAALDENKRITGTAVLSFNGINDTAYRGRLASLKPDERKLYFEDRLKQALGAAKLTRLKIEPEQVRDTTVPLSVQIDFEVDDALADGNGQAVLQVPTFVNQFGLFGRVIGGGIGLDKRRYPLLTEITCGVSETVRLDLSRSGMNPAILPAYETIDTPELYIRRAVTATNAALTSRAGILLRTVEFSPDQYLTLKQNLKASERNSRKRVILEGGSFPSSADYATLSTTVEYTLLDAHNWKEDRTVRCKVLTYAGKKQLSDLKFSYNPAMQQTILAGAAVIAPDGSVKYVDPDKEINIMDAPWAGDAPRYPAEKTLVVSLPGVEVGSTIEYRVVNVYSNMPFFSAAEYFSDFNPLVRKTVRIQAPPRLNLISNSSNPSSLRYSTLELGSNEARQWDCANQPMIKRENSLPPAWVISPSVMFSCGTPEDYAGQIETVLKRAAKPDRTIKAKARELTDGIKSRTGQIAALRDFVDRTIREAGPGFADLPLSAITPAPQVLTEGYGNTTDRAVLLYALLDAAGLKPRFFLSSSLSAAAKVSEQPLEALQRGFFDTVLVAAAGDNKQTLYLGDSGQYAEPGTLAHTGRPAINLESGRIETPQTTLPDGIYTFIKMTLAENGDVSLTCEEQFTGTEFENFHRQFAQFTPEERKRAYQELLSGLSQSAEAAGDMETSFDYPGTLKFSASLPAYASKDGNRMYFTLPDDLGGLINLQSSSRENPFYIGNPGRRVISCSITLPQGWRPVFVPTPIHMELPSGGGFVDVTVSAGMNSLNIQMEAQLNPALIMQDDCDRLLELSNRLTAPAARTLLLKKQ
jgi:transglutaminase-like putative cysteine protease